MRQTTTKTTTVEVRRRYDRSTLLALLFPEGFDHIDRGAKGVQLTVHVPGGGDWSNTDLDVDVDTPLEVRFTMTTIEGEEE